jgi:hypothetical protein
MLRQANCLGRKFDKRKRLRVEIITGLQENLLIKIMED